MKGKKSFYKVVDEQLLPTALQFLRAGDVFVIEYQGKTKTFMATSDPIRKGKEWAINFIDHE